MKLKVKLEQAKMEEVAISADQVGFREGDVVDVKTGPFAGNTGKVLSIDLENAKTEIEAEMMGRRQEISVSISDVKLK